MSERFNLTVTMQVTEAQALALTAMFEYWRKCGSVGMSRDVAFHVDGDGDFQPRCEVTTDKPIRPLTDELRKYAVASDRYGDRVYDFDRIGWSIHHGKNMYTGEPLPG